MQTRTPVPTAARWPFWLATVLLVLAALVVHLVPVADAQAQACSTGSSMVEVDPGEPVAADADPEALLAMLPARDLTPQLSPAIALVGDTQHWEPPPQRPPRPRA